MCNEASLEFIHEALRADEVRGKAVLEVGALDVNGSARAVVEALGPASYLGVDIEDGPGVDLVCAADQLVRRFGPESFNVVLSTEMLEHVRDWPSVVDNLKLVVKPGGVLVLTTRSRGFPFHGYPSDFWRFEIEDLEALFSDFARVTLVRDPSSPGVFFKGRKPLVFHHQSVKEHALYSVITERRTVTVRDAEILRFQARRFAGATAWRLLPGPVHRGLKRWLGL